MELNKFNQSTKYFTRSESGPTFETSSPQEAVKEDKGSITFRKQFDEGGVIGEDGVFEGTDLGTREGFAEIKTKGVIKLRDLAKLFEEYGINLNARNIASKAKTYGLKRPNKVQVAYKDRESTRIVDIKNPKAFYIKPTASELKQIKKQYDVNILKKTSTGPGKVAFDKRAKRANQLLKSKKYTINQVNEILKSEFPEVRTSGMKSTLTKLAKNIKGIPSGREGETATIVKRVKDDLNKLNKSEVKKLLKAGDTNLEKLVNKTSKLLNIDKDLATRRIGQLIQAYAGDDLYLQVKDDLLLRRAKPILKALGNIEETKLFGGIPGGLQRVRAERQFAKNIGKQDAFLSSLRKRIQELIPGSGYQTDEIKNVRSSVKFGTSPYSIFIQGIRSDINQDKVSAIDKKIGTYEKRLQNAKTITEKQKIASKFNEEARAFVSKYNKNLKPGQLPVRALEISFKKPNEVIKNKSALANYGDMFDDIYKKHGYSFKVPSDIKTVDEILPFLKGGRGQKQVLRGIQTQAARLFSGAAALPEMARLGGEVLTQDIPKASSVVERGLKNLRLLRPIAYETGFGAAFAPVDFVSGRPISEILLDIPTLGIAGQTLRAQRLRQTVGPEVFDKIQEQRAARSEGVGGIESAMFEDFDVDETPLEEAIQARADREAEVAKKRQIEDVSESDVFNIPKQDPKTGLRNLPSDIEDDLDVL